MNVTSLRSSSAGFFVDLHPVENIAPVAQHTIEQAKPFFEGAMLHPSQRRIVFTSQWKFEPQRRITSIPRQLKRLANIHGVILCFRGWDQEGSWSMEVLPESERHRQEPQDALAMSAHPTSIPDRMPALRRTFGGRMPPEEVCLGYLHELCDGAHERAVRGYFKEAGSLISRAKKATRAFRMLDGWVWELQRVSDIFAQQEKVPGLEFLPTYPPYKTSWQLAIGRAMRAHYYEMRKPMRGVSLSSIVPHHVAYSREDGGNYLTAINKWRHVILYLLFLEGWSRSQPLPVKALRKAFSYSEDTIPTIARDPSSGYYLVLDGHHRLISLITLVADGILPESILSHIPVDRCPIIPPRKLLEQSFVENEEEAALRATFGWQQALAFHPASVALVERIGALGTLNLFLK